MKNKYQSGFTIIEMLVAIAVTGMMTILVMTFLVNTVATNSKDIAKADLLREAQLTLDLLARDVRLSANVDENNRWIDDNSPNAGPTSGLGWESDSDTLILALAALNSSGDVMFEDAVHYITYKNNGIYFVSNGSLYKRTLVGLVAGNRNVTTCPKAQATASCPADAELAKNVNSFEVKYFNGEDVEVDPVDARSIEVSIGLSQVKYGETITANYTTRTVFRNE